MTFLRSRRGRSLFVLGAAVALTAGALTACSREESPTQPVAGGTLTVANNADAQPSFVLAGRQGNFTWAANVFETLTQYDANSTPQPLLATDWTIAADGLSIDINLRDDVTFHTGRALTADDVKFSFETALDPESGSQVAFIAQKFASIDVTSDTQLSITFTEPLANLFDFFEQTFIIDQETFDGLADGSQVVGTGPFAWDHWDPGSEYVLVRNEGYWGEKAFLDRIEVAVIGDGTAMVNAVRSGRVHYALGLSGTDVTGFENDPQYDLLDGAGSVYPLGMDVNSAPFDNVEVRRAVNYAIDRQRIVDQVFGGLAIPATQFWGPETPGYDTGLNETYSYDPDKAREMIEGAGATGASFEINVIGLDPNVSAAEIVRNNLAAVGLNPTVNVIETTAFGPRQNSSDLGLMFMPLHGLNGYGPATLMNTLPALRGNNPSHFSSDEYQALRAAVASADEAGAPDANLELARYITDQAFSLPLVYAPGYVVTSSSLQDERVTRRFYADFAKAYLTQ